MKEAFKQDMGTLDRVLRVSVGSLPLVLGILVATDTTTTVLVILAFLFSSPALPAFAPVIRFSVYPLSDKEAP